MQILGVIMNIDESRIPGFDPKNAVAIHDGINFVRIPKGTQDGNSTVAIVAPLGDGRFTFIEVTMNNFLIAAAGFRGAEERQREIDAAKGN
jgi:hypothetical protein